MHLDDQPVLVQILSAVAQVEASCRCVGRVNIHADPRCFLLGKPCGQKAKQFRSYCAPSALRNYVDPLQFTITRIPARQVSCNKAHERFALQRNETYTRHQCLLRMEFAIL
jgi:hypothetical protein